MTEYAIWKPEHDGHAPPNWKKGMPWTAEPYAWSYSPSWPEGSGYMVPVEAVGETIPMTKGETVRYGDEGWQPAEALNSPNDDDRSEAEKKADEKLLKATLKLLRQYPAEELAKHGITLAPEKDWAMELWADLLHAWAYPVQARHVRNGTISCQDRLVIELLRTRFEQMIAERSKRDA